MHTDMKRVLHTAPVAVLCLNARAEVLYGNKKAAEIFGGSVERHSIAELSPLSQSGSIQTTDGIKQWLDHSRAQGVTEFFWTHRAFDGRFFPAKVSLQPIIYEGEYCFLSYVQVEGLDRDASAHFLANTNFFRSILDAAPISITIWEENYDIAGCNREALALFKLSSKEEYSEKFFSLSPERQPNGESSREAFSRHMGEARKKGKSAFSWLHQRLDGQLLPVEVTLIWVNINEKMMLVSYVKDLTEQNTYLQRLREADERTQIMLDATPLACDFWDENMVMIDCNLEALKLFKVGSKQEYCEKFFELSPEFQPSGERSSKIAKAKVQEALEKGEVTFDWMHCTLDKEPIDAEVKLVRVLFNNKLHIAGYIRDVRELKHTHQALIQAKEGAESANRAKSTFLSTMSHEIRTPMNAIIGLSDLLSVEKLSPKQKKYVTDIKVSASALLGIINDILDFSKIEAGKLQITPASFNLSQLLANLTSIFTLTAQKKNLRFSLETGADLPQYIYGDEIRIRQIFINLIGNAIKFTQHGHVRVRVSHDAGMLSLTVEDSGIGIKEDLIPTIFDVFKQIGHANMHQENGSGLGLSITKNLVQMMGGDITAASRYGEGSTFYVTLPLTLSDIADGESAHQAEVYISAPDARILVVDDNEINLAVISGLLQYYDITCDCVSSGKEALGKIAENPYDIVFMDHMMPGMDGVETTRRLREKGCSPETLPIIALTANAIDGVRDALLAAQMNDYISKPIDKNLLARILKKWLPENKILRECAAHLGPMCDEAKAENL